jgi:hypothetical protein
MLIQRIKEFLSVEEKEVKFQNEYYELMVNFAYIFLKYRLKLTLFKDFSKMNCKRLFNNLKERSNHIREISYPLTKNLRT